MTNIISILQVIISLVLIVFVLLQQRSSGIGGAFGGGSGGGEFYHSRRGLDKFLYRGTIVLAVLFFILSAAIFVFK